MSDMNVEEMREMRRNHGELTLRLSELCGKVGELVAELRHTQQNNKIIEERVTRQEDALRTLQLESALNKPILDIAKSINSKMWIAIIGAVISVGAGNIDWTKFIG